MSHDLMISLETTQNVLGWPSPDDVTDPQGAGASVFATLAREKIGSSLRQLTQAVKARVGVLMADPDTSTSEPPLAIVVEFDSEIGTEYIRELHRLSWNFSHSPTVITIEPNLLRVWSCCEAPNPEEDIERYLVETVTSVNLGVEKTDELEARAARALHWVNLASGHFFSENASRFDRNGRADQLLLNNLRSIREELQNNGLKNDDICHDLLARVIFVQFLFHRKDQEGNPALTAKKLVRLQKEGILTNRHSSLDSILNDYEDAYRLFDWLNGKFNGDLFPGKGSTSGERADGWAREKRIVKAKHLSLLAEFIRGDVDMASHQMCLWPQYSFDIIPLEFISSVYETFVSERASEDGIYYTPSYLVDFVLDRVLPWDGTAWDLRIIDPACGSGIFLVKSFQRLIHRWKQSNKNVPIRAEILRRLLERNIFGVDKDPHAVRVACFSLYLAMCDEIEPRHYWTQVSFPSMRNSRLVCSDFFSEDKNEVNTNNNFGSYDLVIGNAPFGTDVITEEARKWSTEGGRNWSIPNNDIGGLFLAKGAQFCSENGRVALIQSANTLLFNIGKAAKFRQELFETHRIEEIYNLSAIRFQAFKWKKHTKKTSAAPVCIVIMRKEKPSSDNSILYVSPKNIRSLVDEFSIVVEQYDRRTLTLKDVFRDPAIWSKHMWGSTRDLQLVNKLNAFPSLKKLENEHEVKSRQGINYVDRKKPAPFYEGRKIFDAPMFPDDSIVFLESDNLDTISEARIHSRSSTNSEAFSWPQIIVKHSWHRASGRFHARLCKTKNEPGILVNQSFFSVHANMPILEAACLSHNSKIAVYYHFLTSGRFSAYRPKLSREDILSLPIPPPTEGLLKGIENYSKLDNFTFDLFGLKDAERVLIEDTVEYKLDDLIRGNRSKGRQSTTAGESNEDEAHMRSYCSYFLRVLKAGFGSERAVTATIYRCQTESVPYRLVAFALGQNSYNEIEIKDIRSNSLLSELDRMNHLYKNANGGIYKNRNVRIYEVIKDIPTVVVIKPDQKRFWTRSMGLQDGDEVALDIFKWQQLSHQEDDRKMH